METGPLPVRTISHYRLMEVIGRGAMGEVWLAEDTELPRKVAVKLLPAHLAEDREATERLLREAQTAATVDHPAVVTVYEAGVIEGRPYLVMQWVEGETLGRRLAGGPMPVEEAVGLIASLADALAEVHALGIVHRDLKPDNVILTARGPKILDFGVACVAGAPGLTRTNVTPGTPAIMAPEQLRGSRPDNRSDLWALGVLLYRALTGHPPFDGDSIERLTYQVLNETPVAPSARRADVPSELDYIVLKLLRRDPALRYTRAEDLVADLSSAVQRSSEVGVTPAPPPAPRVAVLYPEVMSAETDDSFLAAGLTEDLIVDLTRVSGVHVASRADVLPYRDRNVPPRTLARELGVDYVLTGSVRRAGQRARISVQLVRTSDGHTTYAERFDRTLEDLFDVQAELSKRIVDALEIALKPGEREMLDRAPTRNAEGYRFYLSGREMLDQGRAENFRAEELLQRAIELDPEFALAHAALAECYATRAQYWWGRQGTTELARTAVRRALALDPDLFEAHFANAILVRIEETPERLLEAIDKVIAMDPNNGQAIEWTAWSYMSLGRLDEALPILERLVKTHPDRYMAGSFLVNCYEMLGRKEDAHRTLAVVRDVELELLRKQPLQVHARSNLAVTMIHLGDVEGGLAQADRTLELAPQDGRILYNAACSYARAGRAERALELLEVAVRHARAYISDWPRRDPDLASLRDHPRFIRIFGKA